MHEATRLIHDRISGHAINFPDLRERWLGFVDRHLMMYSVRAGSAG